MIYSTQLQLLTQAVINKDYAPAAELICADGRLTPQQRLAIYADGYQKRLCDSVASDYPATKNHMGAENFNSAINSFVSATPSIFWDLNLYSIQFAEFLHKTIADEGTKAIAKLEATICEIFWAEDCTPLSASMLNAMNEEQISIAKFTLRNCAKLLHSQWHTNQYLTDFRNNMESLALQSGAQYLLVIRLNNEVVRMELEAAEYVILQNLSDGATFAEALSIASNNYGEAEILAKIGIYMHKWLSLEIFRAT